MRTFLQKILRRIIHVSIQFLNPYKLKIKEHF